jgi:hypothetical protein
MNMDSNSLYNKYLDRTKMIPKYENYKKLSKKKLKLQKEF